MQTVLLTVDYIPASPVQIYVLRLCKNRESRDGDREIVVSQRQLREAGLGEAGDDTNLAGVGRDGDVSVDGDKR